MPYLLQFLQSLTVLALAPLYAGVLTRASAVIQSKRGPSVFQPYRDLSKWLRKGSAVSAPGLLDLPSGARTRQWRATWWSRPSCQSSPAIRCHWPFWGTSLVAPSCSALASFVISLGALDTASPLGGLGTSRTTWIGSLAEPALILVFFTVGVLSASDNPYLMNHALAGSPLALVLPTHVLGAVAFFMLLLAETGHIPVDNPSGTIEISMIEEPRVLEYSGREYAIAKWAGWLKLFLLSAIFMNVFVLPWGLGNGVDLSSGLLGIAAVLGKLAICGGAIVIVDSSFAKLRFFRIAEYIGAAFLLALIGIITSYVVAP